MKSVEITQRVAFSCSYLVRAPDNKCYLQACYYTLDATVQSKADGDKQVFPFEVLRAEMEMVVPDQKFIASTIDNHRHKVTLALADVGAPIEYVSFRVCAESLCAWIAELLQYRIGEQYPGIVVTEVVLNENQMSTAKWRRTY